MSWKSCKQHVLSMSSAEAAYVAGSALVQEVVYLRKLLTNLGFSQIEATPIYADNATCISWSEGSVWGSERAKHMDLRVHYLHEAVRDKIVVLRKIDTHDNAADILTKPVVSIESFENARHQLLGS